MPFSSSRPLLALYLALLISGVGLGMPSASQPVTGFEDQLVSSLFRPTALTFTPDGRMLITTQTGQVRIYTNGSLIEQPALNLENRICMNSERGVLGIAVDPSFTANANNYVYLFYTSKVDGSCDEAINRVSRFTLQGDIMTPNSEQVLIDNIPSTNGNHNAGDVQFGKDGYLYISTGDAGCDYNEDSGCAGNNDASRDRHTLLGKILRITRDGAIPPSNPFVGANSARCHQTGRTQAGKTCQETFAWGLRNPFRMAFDPNTSGTETRFFMNDVGQNTWEEINESQKGADYGWNTREGFCKTGSTTDCSATPPAGMANPVYAYGRSEGAVCNSITGGAFVPNGIWPSEYDNTYLFADYGCGRIFRLAPDGQGTYKAENFVNSLGSSSAVHLTFGPYEGTQALYYTTLANGGQIRRVAYTGDSNRTPTARIQASPTSGIAPLTVNFDGRESSDSDPGDTLSYQWDFGDGNTGTGPIVTHEYTVRGTFTASLVVRDSSGATSAPATILISTDNTAPVPEISVSCEDVNRCYGVGESLTLSATATDADGDEVQFAWTALIHHGLGTGGAHTHPYLPETRGETITMNGAAPEDLLAATNSALEIRLIATDSRGLSSDTISLMMFPKKVDVTLDSEPSGQRMTVNGETITTPMTVVSWAGYQLDVSIPVQPGATGWLRFERWEDDTTAKSIRRITTGQEPLTYTATFTSADILVLPFIQ